MSNHFQRNMSLNNGSVSDSLIDSEYAYPTQVNNGNGSDVQSSSWRTGSSTAHGGSASSGFNLNAYGRPARSNAGTERTYASSMVEWSETSEVRSNGWAKIKAYRPPSPPPGGFSASASGDAASSAGPVMVSQTSRSIQPLAFLLTHYSDPMETRNARSRTTRTRGIPVATMRRRVAMTVMTVMGRTPSSRRSLLQQCFFTGKGMVKVRVRKGDTGVWGYGMAYDIHSPMLKHRSTPAL